MDVGPGVLIGCLAGHRREEFVDVLITVDDRTAFGTGGFGLVTVFAISEAVNVPGVGAGLSTCAQASDAEGHAAEYTADLRGRC